MIRSPFKWVGGKYKLRKKIISLLPNHECYVEVFGGAAWVLLGKEPSNVEVLNDIDGEVINFFRVIKKHPKAFIKSFNWDLVSRNEFQRLSIINSERLSPITRAHRFYYLIMAGWGGELDLPRFQTSVSDNGHGNRLIGALQQLEKRIMPVYSRLQTVIIEQLDWRECIARYDSKNTVMYLDPPYPGNNCNYRYNMRDIKDHQQMANILKGTNAKIILSTYNLPTLKKLFSDYFIQAVEFPSGMQSNHGRRNSELIITNFDYDPSLLTHNNM